MDNEILDFDFLNRKQRRTMMSNKLMRKKEKSFDRIKKIVYSKKYKLPKTEWEKGKSKFVHIRFIEVIQQAMKKITKKQED